MTKMLKTLSLLMLFVLLHACAYGEAARAFTFPQSLAVIEDEAFKNNTSIRGVLDLPESVYAIGAEAFSGCTGLTGVPYIPAGIKEIGARAFYGCEGLSGVLTLPTDVVVGEDAFAGCEGLKVRYADEMPAEYFTYTISNSEVTITGYNGPTGEVDLVIPSRIEKLPVTSIGDSAFRNCSELIGNLVIPESVQHIGQEAFSACRGLTGKLVIPRGVTSIGRDAFYGCSGLTGNLVIPKGVTSIGNRAFYSCSGLTGELVIPEGVTSIGEWVFGYCGGFTGKLVIPESVASIGDSAFYDCIGLTGNLIIPEGVTSIGEYAFYNCRGFTGDLIIPDNVTSIDDGVFSYCIGLTGNLVIPESVTSIGEYAFDSCKGFTGDLIIPESVTSIGDGAFNFCCGLTGELVIPDSVQSIGREAFSVCSGLTGNLIIPKSVTSIGEYAFDSCKGFTGDLIIPESVTSIGNGAFSGCSGLTGNLVIPESVTSIGEYTFYSCSGFTGDLIIPESVTSIGGGAFRDCSGLTGKLVIPGSVTSIDEVAFYNCSGFTGDLIIPDSVQSIGEYAFKGCTNLSLVVLPDDLTIPDNVFSSCSTDLVIKTRKEYLVGDPRIAEEFLFKMMSEWIEGPESLPHSLKADESDTWFHYLIYTLEDLSHFEWSYIVDAVVDKPRFLFEQAMKFENPNKVLVIPDIELAPDVLRDIKKTIDSANNQYFEGFLDMIPTRCWVYVKEDDAFREIFKSYVSSSNIVNSSNDFIKEAKNQLDNFEIEKKLIAYGVDKDDIPTVMNSMEVMYGLNYINETAKKLTDAQRVTDCAIEIRNHYLLLESLDKETMLKYAQVYMESEDYSIYCVGKTIKEYYEKDAQGRLLHICKDSIMHTILKKLLSDAMKWVRVQAGTAAGGYMVAISATNIALDLLTGVDKIPQLMRNLQYSSEMTDGVYEVFLKRLEEYKKTPTDELFEETYWAFMTYCNVAKLGEKAFVEIYNTVGKTVLGGLFITDEAEKVVQWSGEIADNIGRLMADANAAYNWRNTGDYESFVEAIEKIRSETYVTPYPGGSGSGGGAW